VTKNIFGQTEGWTEAKQYTPSPVEQGYNNYPKVSFDIYWPSKPHLNFIYKFIYGIYRRALLQISVNGQGEITPFYFQKCWPMQRISGFDKINLICLEKEPKEHGAFFCTRLNLHL
jgi:hypothetical protein